MSEICIIVACGENNAIGKDNKMPWHLPADLKYFKKQTTGCSVIMGRLTMESIGKALPNRRNIVISRQSGFKYEGAETANSLTNALALCETEEKVFIIGGGQIFKQSLELADSVYLTRIHEEFEADAYFPHLNINQWRETASESFSRDEKNPYAYSFKVFERIRQ